MPELLPRDVYQSIEAEVRSALGRRIAEADGYAQNRDTMKCTTVMKISKGSVTTVVTIKTYWSDHEPKEMEMK